MADTQTCPFCHSQHPIQARFCPKTGQAIPEPPAINSVVCPACGNATDTAGRFCPECGYQLVPAPQTLAAPITAKTANYAGAVTINEPVTAPGPTPTYPGFEPENWNGYTQTADQTQYTPTGAPYEPPARKRFPWVWVGVVVVVTALCCIMAGVGLFLFRSQGAGISFLQPFFGPASGLTPEAGLTPETDAGTVQPPAGQTAPTTPVVSPTILIFTTPSLALKPTITPPGPATATAPVSPTVTALAKTPTQTITRTGTATAMSSNPCPDGFTSHLAVGIKAMVSLQPDLPNNVRENPGLSGRIVGVIHPGDMLDIIGGPSCSNHWVWWYIQYDGSKRGWTAEGDSKDYWIVAQPGNR